MQRWNRRIAALIGLSALAVMVSGCPRPPVSTFKDGYVGSAKCGECHEEQYNEFILSGHSYKINKVVNNQPPTYPFPFLGTKANVVNVPNPPIDWDGRQIGWDEITYVIGGYGWKARFMDSEGYIMTQFAEDDPQGRQRSTQWNPPRFPGDNQRWVPYSHPSDDQAALGKARKPYNCGKCHTTAWEDATPEEIADFENNKEAFQDGLPGIQGTWSEPGVHCEACHGPGAAHAESQLAADITIETSDAPDDLPGKRCGECHTRDANNRILASGGFIRHHEQYDELLASPHANIKCVTCHDPHQPTRYDPEAGIKIDCTTCHPDKSVDRPSMANLACIDCHMGSATKSGIAYNEHEGDVRTHVFKIITDAIGAEDEGGMFYNDPTDNALVSRGYLTLDFACQRCHNGTNASDQTLEELSAVAPLIHANN